MTSSNAGAGWYPDPEQHGQQRYWDGDAWTEHRAPTAPRSQDQTPTTASSVANTRKTQSVSSSGEPSSGEPRGAWYGKWWVVAVAAFLTGLVIGVASAGAADPKDSPEYQALAKDLDQSREALADREAELADSADELKATKTELDEVAGDLPAREKAVAASEAALKKREKAVAKREAEARQAAKALLRREKAVGIAERQVAANTISGEGLFEVGVDMKAGTYKTSGMADCYYAVLGDANGNNIKSNNITSGPAVVSVGPGDYFQSRGCAEWVLQR